MSGRAMPPDADPDKQAQIAFGHMAWVQASVEAWLAMLFEVLDGGADDDVT